MAGPDRLPDRLAGGYGCLPRELIVDGGLIGLTKAEVQVLLVIAAHMDENGVAFPSEDTIARHAGLAKRSVQRALRQLKKRHTRSGVPVLVVVRQGVGRGHSSIYAVFPKGDSAVALSFGPNGDRPVVLSEEKATPRYKKRRHFGPQKVTPQSPQHRGTRKEQAAARSGCLPSQAAAKEVAIVQRDVAAIDAELDALSNEALEELQKKTIAQAENDFLRVQYQRGDPHRSQLLRFAMGRLLRREREEAPVE